MPCLLFFPKIDCNSYRIKMTDAIYFGPATQEFLAKYKLAHHTETEWIELERLKAVLFNGEKNHNGDYKFTGKGVNKTAVLNYTSRSAAAPYIKNLSSDRFRILDDTVYIHLIDAICSATNYNSSNELKLFCSLPTRNLMRASENTTEKTAEKIRFRTNKLDDTELSTTNVLRSLAEIRIEPFLRAYEKLDETTRFIKDEILEIKTKTDGAQLVVGMYRKCIEELSANKYVQYSIQSNVFSLFLKYYNTEGNISSDITKICEEYLLFDDDQKFTVYLLTRENDYNIETVISTKLFEVSQSIISPPDQRLTGMIANNGFEWNDHRNHVIVIKLSEDSYLMNDTLLSIMHREKMFQDYLDDKITQF